VYEILFHLELIYAFKVYYMIIPSLPYVRTIPKSKSRFLVPNAHLLQDRGASPERVHFLNCDILTDATEIKYSRVQAQWLVHPLTLFHKPIRSRMKQGCLESRLPDAHFCPTFDQACAAVHIKSYIINSYILKSWLHLATLP
jgi:hypothetical protein